jgi:small-conductance mechanosensitive channel
MVLYLVEKVFFKRKNENEPFDPSVMSFLSLIINLTLWLVVILIVLQNLGINVNTIAGSLGIAGVAVAFAMQNILADIFASFSLYFDQPFKIGHKIEFSGEIGRVEKIGIKTTRIRLESGELLVVSNKELAQAKVKNLSLRESYTQIIKLAIPTKTDSKKLNNITIWAEKIINQFEESTFEKANIKEIKADNFIIQIKYTIDTHIQARFEEIQEHIYLQLKDQLDAEEIVFEGA